MLLATREIRRSRLRFGLLAGAVGLLVFLVFYQQVLLGSLLKSFIGALENQSADVLVYSGEARQSIEGSAVSTAVVEQIGQVDGVARAAPVGESTITFEAGGDQVDVAVFGAEPGGPGSPTRVVAGRAPAARGEGVASREDQGKGFGIGTTVSTAAGGAPVTIVGLSEQSQFSVQPTLFVTFETFTDLRRAVNPAAGEVVPSAAGVETTDGASADDVARAIARDVPGIEALTRSEAVARAPGVSAVKASFAIVLALAIGVVALVTGFFFLILTVQKAASLTLMRAVGAPVGYLVRGLLQQVGLVLGVALVVAVVLVLGAVASGGTGVALAIPWRSLGVAALVIVALSMVGVAFSVWRVVRIEPAAAVARQGLGDVE